jgi:hypothetical protein
MQPRKILTLIATLSITVRAPASAYATTSSCTTFIPLNNPPQVPINACVSTMAEQPNTEWLQNRLSQLLSSPYIHFTQPKVPGLHLRMGPGPIDLFSTRFMNLFTENAQGNVNGQEMGKDDLKQALLALQKTFNKDSVQFKPQTADGEEVRLHF